MKPNQPNRPEKPEKPDRPEKLDKLDKRDSLTNVYKTNNLCIYKYGEACNEDFGQNDIHKAGYEACR